MTRLVHAAVACGEDGYMVQLEAHVPPLLDDALLEGSPLDDALLEGSPLDDALLEVVLVDDVPVSGWSAHSSMQQKGAQPPDALLLDDVLPGEPPPEEPPLEELLLEEPLLPDRQPEDVPPEELLPLPQMLPPQRDCAHWSQGTRSSQPAEWME